jgi:transcription initiation factor TFIID subunit TAF12
MTADNEFRAGHGEALQVHARGAAAAAPSQQQQLAEVQRRMQELQARLLQEQSRLGSASSALQVPAFPTTAVAWASASRASACDPARIPGCLHGCGICPFSFQTYEFPP